MLIIENFTSHGPRAMQLILEKITPPSQSTRVPRPRLLGILQESLKSYATTIVNGRAGSGKTTLSADFARRSGRAIAWYKVDAPDGDPQVFFKYLIASIQQQRPGFGEENLRPLLESADIDRMPLLAEAFVYELLEGEHTPLLIVIEDLHLVYDDSWVAPFFRRLLPLLPSDVHMLITSRTMPPAPLWRMRSKQSLSVIDEAELSFTRQEAIELFESHGLSREQASIALDHTHGRAAALNVCAESMTGTPENGTGSPGEKKYAAHATNLGKPQP
jgi:LuxR family maltose regulon positive regulatory protein